MSHMKKSDETLIDQLIEIVTKLKWNIALPMNNNLKEENVPGMIVGNEHFITEILGAYNSEGTYYKNPNSKEDNGGLH